ncbi:MAG: flagellar biosynthesis anti-sigma factor FlgM [bacterium]
MKIQGTGKNGIAVSGAEAPSAKRVKETSGASGAVRKDRVCLSDDLKQIREMERSGRGAEEVRMHLVEALQKKIREGTYEPDSRKVADKWIGAVLEETSKE